MDGVGPDRLWASGTNTSLNSWIGAPFPTANSLLPVLKLGYLETPCLLRWEGNTKPQAGQRIHTDFHLGFCEPPSPPAKPPAA
jgi:hypothetical protein